MGCPPPQFVQQEERRQRAEAQRQQEQQAQQLQQLQQQQAESLAELEQVQVLGTTAKLPTPGASHTPATSPRAPSFPFLPSLSQSEKMHLLAEQERRQLGQLDQEHVMELSEWKQRLAARKEVSGPAARSIPSLSWPSSRDATEGCPPRCKPPQRGARDVAVLLLSSRCWKKNWGTRCRCSGEEGCMVPTAATGSSASSTSPPDTMPQITGERQAAAWGPVPWLFWEMGLKDLKGKVRGSCPGGDEPWGRAGRGTDPGGGRQGCVQAHPRHAGGAEVKQALPPHIAPEVPWGSLPHWSQSCGYKGGLLALPVQTSPQLNCNSRKYILS